MNIKSIKEKFHCFWVFFLTIIIINYMTIPKTHSVVRRREKNGLLQVSNTLVTSLDLNGTEIPIWDVRLICPANRRSWDKPKNFQPDISLLSLL